MGCLPVKNGETACIANRFDVQSLYNVHDPLHACTREHAQSHSFVELGPPRIIAADTVKLWHAAETYLQFWKVCCNQIWRHSYQRLQHINTIMGCHASSICIRCMHGSYIVCFCRGPVHVFAVWNSHPFRAHFRGVLAIWQIYLDCSAIRPDNCGLVARGRLGGGCGACAFM